MPEKKIGEFSVWGFLLSTTILFVIGLSMFSTLSFRVTQSPDNQSIEVLTHRIEVLEKQRQADSEKLIQLEVRLQTAKQPRKRK